MSKSVLSFKELTSFFKKGNCKLIVSFRIDTVMLAVFMVKNNIKTNEISLPFALDIEFSLGQPYFFTESEDLLIPKQIYY